MHVRVWRASQPFLKLASHILEPAQPRTWLLCSRPNEVTISYFGQLLPPDIMGPSRTEKKRINKNRDASGGQGGGRPKKKCRYCGTLVLQGVPYSNHLKQCANFKEHASGRSSNTEGTRDARLSGVSEDPNRTTREHAREYDDGQQDSNQHESCNDGASEPLDDAEPNHFVRAKFRRSNQREPNTATHLTPSSIRTVVADPGLLAERVADTVINERRPRPASPPPLEQIAPIVPAEIEVTAFSENWTDWQDTCNDDRDIESIHDSLPGLDDVEGPSMPDPEKVICPSFGSEDRRRDGNPW